MLAADQILAEIPMCRRCRRSMRCPRLEERLTAGAATNNGRLVSLSRPRGVRTTIECQELVGDTFMDKCAVLKFMERNAAARLSELGAFLSH